MRISLITVLAVIWIMTFLACSDKDNPIKDSELFIIDLQYPEPGNEISNNTIFSFKTNAAMDPASVTTSTFIVRNLFDNDSLVVAGTRAVNEKTLSFTPNTNYRYDSIVRIILKGIKSSGGKVIENQNFQFVVESAPPPSYLRVIKTTPNNLETNVSTSSNIIVQFSESISSASIDVNNPFHPTFFGVKTIDGDKLIFDPVLSFPPNIKVTFKVGSATSVTGTGNNLQNEHASSFETREHDVFPIIEGASYAEVHVDVQGRIYFAGSVIHRYFADGKLDTTISLDFIDAGFVSDIDITDNGNIYCACQLNNDAVVVLEFDNNLNYLNYYSINATGWSWLLVAAGNSVYYYGGSFITNIFSGKSTNVGARKVIFDPVQNILVANRSSGDNHELVTTAYSLDLEQIWQQFFLGDTSPWVNALVKNPAGNYFSFGNFINYSQMRLEYSPTGVPLDTVDLGRVDVRDAQPSPVHGVIVVPKDLGSGYRVAVHSDSKWYITCASAHFRFFDMLTKNEIKGLRR